MRARDLRGCGIGSWSGQVIRLGTCIPVFPTDPHQTPIWI